MYFLRKKRAKQDLEAGLIFQWRGSKKHHFGKIIAFMVAIGFFAFSVYAIKIDGLKAPLLSKREGVVIMLNEDDPNCRALMLQIEERSPFPVRWDPAFDEEIMARIDTEKKTRHGKLWIYKAELVPLPDEEPPHRLASIIEPHHGLLGRVSDQWRWVRPVDGVGLHGDLLIRAKVIANGSLKVRLPQDELALPPDLVADDWFGQTFRFQVSLEASGVVRSCVALPGGTTDVSKVTDRQKNLAAWIRTQQFKAAKLGSKTIDAGQLEIQIEASRE